MKPELLDGQFEGGAGTAAADAPIAAKGISPAVLGRVYDVLAEDFLGELSSYYEHAGWGDILDEFIFPTELTAALSKSEALFEEWRDHKGTLRPESPLFKKVSAALYDRLLTRLGTIDTDASPVEALHCIIFIAESSMAMGNEVPLAVTRIFRRVGKIIEASSDEGARAIYARAMAKLPAALTRDAEKITGERIAQAVHPHSINLTPAQLIGMRRAAENEGRYVVALALAQTFFARVGNIKITLPIEINEDSARTVLASLGGLDAALSAAQPDLYESESGELAGDAAALLEKINDIITDEVSLARAVTVAQAPLQDEEESVLDGDAEYVDEMPAPEEDGAPEYDEPEAPAEEPAEPVPPPIQRTAAAPAGDSTNQVLRAPAPMRDPEPAATPKFPKIFSGLTAELVAVCTEEQLRDYAFQANEARNFQWEIRIVEELLRRNPTPGMRFTYALALAEVRRFEEAHEVATALATTIGNNNRYRDLASDNTRLLRRLLPHVEIRPERQTELERESKPSVHHLIAEAKADLPEDLDEMDYQELRTLLDELNRNRAENRKRILAVQHRMVEVSPGSPSTHFFYGRVLEEFGYNTEAHAEYLFSEKITNDRGGEEDPRRAANLTMAINRTGRAIKAAQQTDAGDDAEEFERYDRMPFFTFVTKIAVSMKRWPVVDSASFLPERTIPDSVKFFLEQALTYFAQTELHLYPEKQFLPFNQAYEAFAAEISAGTLGDKTVRTLLQSQFWRQESPPKGR